MLAGVVDGVLLRLTERVEAKALVQLSTALAELKVAPPETLQRLASHDDPDVACPVLLKSQAVSATDLATIAASWGERHQRAIAARNSIEPEVAEALIKRGGPICLALIKNPGTQFSEAAYAALIARADPDDEIAKALVLRPGTPDLVVRKLLSQKAPAPKAPAKANASTIPPAQRAAPVPLKLPCPADYASAPGDRRPQPRRQAQRFHRQPLHDPRRDGQSVHGAVGALGRSDRDRGARHDR
ncbi:uncharacterized protein (DUF2336 family) [Bradyrhizobium japonicum]|nr:uncharacterized protein (DUF2336 family) [Bradyrhizobium japonicum]MCP1858501.1 uncharacterized protein (DUF2336 family) [Bradyrhizobium japonicum]MCP1889312.1 uncharacterized protein (DUF2336 family) [Bradyrhizobium japonicum]MCW2322290.1 uncharacterized protein (DUF2336 family) [Bradyrhizobium japonicum]